ncbi:hypothetical protein QFZ49_003613 [Streptomyces turgidiscabies]|uniref:Response regulatory domain-containing protein n=1 Tax=Streptomyces turgidiscabies TaxID=85558 RepID=A0ABU0RPM2_9ACTN|nr:hypothetical protein [Streptomyces turgidiscabies]
MDVTMPELDGLAALRRLRASGCTVPAIESRSHRTYYGHRKGPKAIRLGPSERNRNGTATAYYSYCTTVIRFAVGGVIGVVAVELAVR